MRVPALAVVEDVDVVEYRVCELDSGLPLPAVEYVDLHRGLERMKLHDLRHTAAGLTADSGANVKGVQRMLGHADAAMTLDTYADLRDGHWDAVADRLDQARSKALTDSARTGHGRVLPMRELKSS